MTGDPHDHARPGAAEQRAALAIARAILGGADPAAVREAAGDRGCPTCTTVAGISLGVNLAAMLAGLKLGPVPGAGPRHARRRRCGRG